MNPLICQRCHDFYAGWTLRQAELSVGSLNGWKVQLCPDCTKVVEQAVLKVLTEIEVKR